MRSFGTPQEDFGCAVVCDFAGGAQLTGGIDGAVDFGGGPVSVTQGHGNLFLGRSDAAGAHVWSRASDCDGFHTQGVAEALLDTGEVLIGGLAPSEDTTCLDFGGGPLGASEVWLVEVAQWSAGTGDR